MLCLPGLTPVAKLDQAVGDSEGWVEPSRAKVPSSASAFRFGSLPSSIHFRARVGSIPSKPMTKTRCFVRRRGLPPSQTLPAVDEGGEGERVTRRRRPRRGRQRRATRRTAGSSRATCFKSQSTRRLAWRGKPLESCARGLAPGTASPVPDLEWPVSCRRPSSVLCPSCGTLVGVKDPQCLSCGRRNPGMWGFAHLLRNVGDDMGFATLVMWACGALYLATLAADLEGVAGLGAAVVPVAEHAEPVPVRGERRGAGVRLRALVDGAERRAGCTAACCTSSST